MVSPFRRVVLPVVFLPALFFFWLTVLVLPAAAKNTKRVQVSDENWQVKGTDGEAGKAETELRDAVVAWQDAWVRRDIAACKNILTDSAMMVLQEHGEICSGRDAILAALPLAWEEFETDDHGSSALTCTLLKVKVEVRDNTALLHYYMDVSGGNLWAFEDRAAFVQIFVRKSPKNAWQLAFGGGSWGLGYDPDSGEAEEPTFAYDYGLPVKDLARAVKFYRTLLGEPEALTKTIAVFELKGSRLYLVAGEMDRLAPLRPGLPNGWVILMPPDFDSARDDAEEKGMSFEGGEQTFADLRVLYGYEPAGNLVALARPVEGMPAGTSPKLIGEGTIQGDPLLPSVASADAALRTALLNGDVDGYLRQCNPDATMLDSARSRTRGWSSGERKLRKTLRRDFGKREKDEGRRAAHPFATLELQDGLSRRLGPWQVIARRRITRGGEPWKRSQESLETCIHSVDSGRLALHLTLLNARPQGLALQFDYSGTPVTGDAWKKTNQAFRALTGGADTYKDEDWKGFWGERAVMGMFLADPKEDRMPRRHEASTYLSMDVRKIEKAEAFAKQNGSQFPSVPAINGGKPGINRLRGYNQLYFTDSEGNGIVLTEYTGRGKPRGAKDDE